MKKYWFILMVVMIGMLGCSKVRRSPGRTYMPDMVYSRAYETYASTENLQKKGIHYTGLPVAGTIARGDMLQIYTIPNDTTGYKLSASVKNPLNADSIDMKESERIYLVNCGICHGGKLDGNGPLWKDGAGPFPAAPKNFLAEDMKKLADGTYFHSITYGKGQMGSYASQLNTMQRWMVISYIRSKQGGGAAKDSTAKTVVVTDTTKMTK